MIFSYKAKSKEGEIFEGSMNSTDRFAVAREIKIRGFIPLSISKKNQQLANLNSSFEKFFGKVKISEQIIFTKNLSGMLKAGLSISRALSVLQKQTKNKTFNAILISISDEINKGGNLSSGMAKHPKAFSPLFISMVRAGEESGNLVGALNEVGSNLEKAHSLTKKVKGALIYPSVILSAMILIGILMFAFVVPTLAKTFTELGTELPVSTKIIISLGNFFSNNLILTFIIIVGMIFLFSWLSKAVFMKKYFDFIFIRIPLVGGLIRELNTARTARTLSSLLSSGVSITRSIEITQEVVQNMYYRKILEKAKTGIEKGFPFSEAFISDNKLYPVMMAEMIQVGEETGKLSEMLHDIAIFYEEEIDNKTKNLSTIIEPFLMIIIGSAVGFFAVSMITPMYTVMDTIN